MTAPGTPTRERAALTLHIGTHKTASTVIQRALTASRTALLEDGVWYPDLGEHCAGAVSWLHWDLATHLVRPRASRLSPAGFESFRRELASPPASHTVLSAENLWGLPPNPDPDEPLEQYLRRKRSYVERLAEVVGTDTAVLVYLRPQPSYALSLFNQTVKQNRFTGRDVEDAFQLFLRKGAKFEYAAQLRLWADVFGVDNVVVRVFERGELVGDDPLSDFTATVGLRGVTPGSASAANRSWSLAAARLKVAINRLEGLTQKDGSRIRAVIEEVATDEVLYRRDEARLYHSEGVAALRERHAEGNAWIARTFLGRAELFAGDGVSSREPVGEDDSYEGALDLAAAIVAELALGAGRGADG